jgi:hypothetical protein
MMSAVGVTRTRVLARVPDDGHERPDLLAAVGVGVGRARPLLGIAQEAVVALQRVGGHQQRRVVGEHPDVGQRVELVRDHRVVRRDPVGARREAGAGAVVEPRHRRAVDLARGKLQHLKVARRDHPRLQPLDHRRHPLRRRVARHLDAHRQHRVGVGHHDRVLLRRGRAPAGLHDVVQVDAVVLAADVAVGHRVVGAEHHALPPAARLARGWCRSPAAGRSPSRRRGTARPRGSSRCSAAPPGGTPRTRAGRRRPGREGGTRPRSPA